MSTVKEKVAERERRQKAQQEKDQRGGRHFEEEEEPPRGAAPTIGGGDGAVKARAAKINVASGPREAVPVPAPAANVPPRPAPIARASSTIGDIFQPVPSVVPDTYAINVRPFEYRGKQWPMYTVTGDEQLLKGVSHMPILLPEMDRVRTNKVRTEGPTKFTSATGQVKFKLSVFLEVFSDASFAAMAKGFHPPDGDNVRTKAVIPCKAIFASLVPPIMFDTRFIGLDSSNLVDALYMPRHVELKFISSYEKPLELLRDRDLHLARVQFDLHMQGRDETRAEARVRLSFAHDAAFSAFLKDLDPARKGEFYIHRDDARTIAATMSVKMKREEHLEDPLVRLTDDIEQRILKEWFSPEGALGGGGIPTFKTLTSEDGALLESTFNKKELAPDVLTRQVNRLFSKDAGAKMVRVSKDVADALEKRDAEASQTSVESSGGASFMGISAQAKNQVSLARASDHFYSTHKREAFSFDELEEYLRENDILAEVEGEEIKVKAIKVTQMNKAQFNQDFDLGNLKVVSLKKHFHAESFAWLAPDQACDEDDGFSVTWTEPAQLILGCQEDGKLEFFRPLKMAVGTYAAGSAEAVAENICRLMGLRRLEISEKNLGVVTVVGIQQHGKSTLLRNIFGIREFESGGYATSSIGQTIGLVGSNVTMKRPTGESRRVLVIDAEGLFSAQAYALDLPPEILSKFEVLKTVWQFYLSSVVLLVFKDAKQAGAELQNLVQAVGNELTKLKAAAKETYRSPRLVIVINKQPLNEYHSALELLSHGDSNATDPILRALSAQYNRLLTSPFVVGLFSRPHLVVVPDFNQSSRLFQVVSRQLRDTILREIDQVPFPLNDELLWAKLAVDVLGQINEGVDSGMIGRDSYEKFRVEQETYVTLAIAEKFKIFKPLASIMDETLYDEHLKATKTEFAKLGHRLDSDFYVTSLTNKCSNLYKQEYSKCEQVCACTRSTTSPAKECTKRKDRCAEGGNLHRCGGVSVPCANAAHGCVRMHTWACPVSDAQLVPVKDCCRQNQCFMCALRCEQPMGHSTQETHHACAGHIQYSRHCRQACIVGACEHASGTAVQACAELCARHPNHGGIHTCSTNNHDKLASGFVMRSEHSWFLSRSLTGDGGPHESTTPHTFVLDQVAGQPANVVKIRHVGTGTFLDRRDGGRGWFHGAAAPDERFWLFRVVGVKNSGLWNGQWGVAFESCCADRHHVSLPRGGWVGYVGHIDNGEWFFLT